MIPVLLLRSVGLWFTHKLILTLRFIIVLAHTLIFTFLILGLPFLQYMSIIYRQCVGLVRTFHTTHIHWTLSSPENISVNQMNYTHFTFLINNYYSMADHNPDVGNTEMRSGYRVQYCAISNIYGYWYCLCSDLAAAELGAFSSTVSEISSFTPGSVFFG